MLHHWKFQLQGYSFFFYCLYCLYYYGLYFYSFYLFDKKEGRTRTAVTWKAVRTNFIWNSIKQLKEHRSLESSEACWVSCYSFVNFLKIVTMFLNLDVLETNLWSIFFCIGPCACKEICKFICSFNLPKVMKTCWANFPSWTWWVFLLTSYSVQR